MLRYTGVLILAMTTMVAAQTYDTPAPTAVPFTPRPRQLQWRIGFDLGNALILEAPELNPENDLKQAVRESERVLPHPMLSFGLALLPFSRIATRAQQLVNPREWTVVNLHGDVKRKAFQGIGVFMGKLMNSTEGGYHLVSVPSMPSSPFLGLRQEPSSEDLIFGLAGPTKRKPRIQIKLSETSWKNLLPVEISEELPPGYESAKQLLGEGEPVESQRFLYGTSILASVQNRASKVWLLNYSHPDMEMGSHPWGIFVERPERIEPLYIFKPAHSQNDYAAYLIAAIDLNQDGNDELIIEASYRKGIAYKVISPVGSNYQEIHSSYYRGPQQ